MAGNICQDAKTLLPTRRRCKSKRTTVKRRTNKRPQGVYRAFEITVFLREIDRFLPSIQTPEHRAAVIQTRNLLMAASMSRPPAPGEIPSCLVVTEETLVDVIETLRCCGIAPAGWPQPPGPDALLQPRAVMVLGWDGTDGQGGSR
jgi:hypothetical protein